MHKGAKLRDKALDRLEQAHEEWIKSALLAVFREAQIKREFTTDDVWKLVGTPPKEARAMGAVMRKASSRGWVGATDRTVLSDRPECHRRPVRVWVSKIYAEMLP